MELLPRAVVVGVFSSLGMPGSEATAEKLNRVWLDVSPKYGYTQLQMAPDGTAANFLGRTPEDGVTIQPPLVQVRVGAELLTVEHSADKAQDIIQTVARHLSPVQFFNLGIKHVYNAPLPDRDGRGFVLHRVLGQGEDALTELKVGDDLWAGVKFVTSYTDVTYTLQVEPLVADGFQSLFVDMDAQFAGPTTPDAIVGRAREAAGYVTGAVNRYLSKL